MNRPRPRGRSLIRPRSSWHLFTSGRMLTAGLGAAPGMSDPALAKERGVQEYAWAGGAPRYRPYARSAPYLDRKAQRKTRYWKGGKSLDSANALGESHLNMAKAKVAARLIGQGSISRLQAFQGSRVLHFGKRNFNSMGDEIICTDPITGSKLWAAKLPGNIKQAGGFLATPPAAAGKYIFVGLLKGSVLMVNPKNGTTRKTFKVGARIRSQPVIHNGWIYVGTQNGKLVAINTGNSRLTGWPQWGGDASRSGIR